MIIKFIPIVNLGNDFKDRGSLIKNGLLKSDDPEVFKFISTAILWGHDLGLPRSLFK